MRRWACSIGVGALALTLAACGGGNATLDGSAGGAGGAAKSGESSGDQVYAQLNGQGSDAVKSAAAAAKKEGEVSFYTSANEKVASGLAKAFTAKYGIPVKVYRASSETVLQRMLQEGKAGRPGADVVETNFAEMEALASEGQISDYEGPAMENVPSEAKFDHWTADRYNVFLPAWNTDLIKPGDEPHSWADLADPKYKGKIEIEVGDYDWFENLTKYWLAHGETQAEVDQLWKGIVANSRTAKGHAGMMDALGAGQTALNGMNYTYEADLLKAKGAPVAYKGPDGTTSIPAFPRPNGVSPVAAAAHPNAAWLFTDWLLSDGQKTLSDLAQTPVADVPGNDSLKGITLAPFDVEGLSKDSKSWAEKYDALLRGVPKASD